MKRPFNESATRVFHGEVILADNGSTDGSREIAQSKGTRVVEIPNKGYGNALIGGIGEARGRFVIMGDADNSYDFSTLEGFVQKLRAGNELYVQGCRFPKGGGRIMSNAMPFLHRSWGNPTFSLLARVWFGAQINDVNCGLRGFSKALAACAWMTANFSRRRSPERIDAQWPLNIMR